MTEIQFLLQLMLEHKPSPAIKKLILARIGEVEANLLKPTQPARAVPYQGGAVLPRISDGEPPPTPKPRDIPPTILVSTGDGLKAPRKW